MPRVASLLALTLVGIAAAFALPAPTGSQARPASDPTLRAASVLVLQPGGVAGVDTFLWDLTPAWNFGDNASLLVGPDAANGSLGRALLSFDVSAIPANATLVRATLELFQHAGGAGRVEFRRATAPWAEGDGGRSWTRVPVTVSEVAGVRRVLEPVPLDLSFARWSVEDPARDLRVYDGATEVASQVYDVALVGADVVGATLALPVTIPAYGTRSFTVVYSTNGTAVPAYRMRSFEPAPLWISRPVGTGASGVTLADVSGTGTLDIVFGTSDGWVRVLTPANTTRWETRLSATASVPFPPQVADLDADGRMDIVVAATDRTVVRLNETGGTAWRVSIGKNPTAAPTLLDVNGDGVLDVLVGNDGGSLEAHDGRDGTLIRSYNGGVGQFTPAVLDLDLDGVGEFYFGGDDRKVHAYRVGGTEMWGRNPGGTDKIWTSVALGDVNQDGATDVVTGDIANGDQEFALRASDGATVWVVSLPSSREGHQTLADLDGDGALEVLVGTAAGTLYALRGSDGSTLWTYPGTSLPIAPAVVDLDPGGRPEIVYMDLGPSVRVLNATGALVHSWMIAPNNPGLVTTQQKPMSSPGVADLDGDGTLEVVVPTGAGVAVFRTPGLARDWRTFGYNWNHTHRTGDGSSPDGAPYLVTIAGAPETVPGTGASWAYRDGAAPWSAVGGDFTASDDVADVGPGWSSWNVTDFVADLRAGTYPPVGLFLTEADEASGVFHAFHSSDAPDPGRRPRLTIEYTVPIADPNPRITRAIPDQVRAEDSPSWSLDLTDFAADGDTPATALRWNVTGCDPAIVQVTGLNTPGNHVLRFAPQKDAFGSMRVEYWLTDPEGHAARASAWLNLTPVNDAPSFNPPPTFVVHHDEPYTFDFGPYIADVDTPPGGLSLRSSDPSQAAVTGFNVAFLLPESYLGQWVFFTLTVSDGEFSAPRSVAVRVTSNHPPQVVRALPDVTLQEGELRVGVFDLDDYFTDRNNDTLFFSFGYSHLTVTIHPDHSVDIEAEAEWSGQETVTFRGTDSGDAIAEDSILVTVMPTDDPPVLGPVPDFVVHFDADYTFNIAPYVSDPDTPLGQLNASASSPYVAVTGLLLTLTFPEALNGTTIPVTIWVGDGTQVVSRTILVTVTDDWPPVLTTKLPNLVFPEDTAVPGAYNLSAFFADPDGEPVYYSSGQDRVIISIDGWGRVDVRATQDFFGSEQVTFRATDPFGALAEDSVLITVIPVNDAPFFRPMPTVRLNATTAYLDLSPYLGDVDTNLSELRVFTGSSYGTVVGRGLILNVTQDGTFDVPVQLTDGELSASAILSVEVKLPGPERILVPTTPYPYWVPPLVAAAGAAGFIAYRRRKLEWAFLVTNAGLLACSRSRRTPTDLDQDLVTGMLTTIMDFARKTFSSDKDRDLEGLSLGEKRVAIVRGTRGYLAVVYLGRTPGSLLRIMRSLLTEVEARHADVLGDVVDTSKAGTVSGLLERLLRYGWWPFLTFASEDRPAVAPGGGNA